MTQATIGSAICVKGWTKTSRPPESYTNAPKKALWHYPDRNPSHYEEDHLISLEQRDLCPCRASWRPSPRPRL